MADKIGNTIDRKLNIENKPKRVDIREFKKCWKAFNDNINIFFEKNKESPMGASEDEAEFGGIEEDDVIGVSPAGGRSNKSEKQMKFEM